MKTNQIFSLNRFGRYAKCTFISNYRQTLLFWGAIIFIIIAISMFVMRSVHSGWNMRGWEPIFILGFYFAGAIYAGFAFPGFRSKERTQTELLIPVTNLERLIYEFFVKVIAFIILYPIVFYISSSVAVGIINTFHLNTVNATLNDISTFPFKTISLASLIKPMPPGVFTMICMLSVAVLTIAYAGAATFRKLPFIKTVVFTGSVLLSGIAYISLISKRFSLENSWPNFFAHRFTEKQGFLIGTLVFAFITLVALVYTYFKLKEKEAS